MKVHPAMEVVRIRCAEHEAGEVEIKMLWLDDHGNVRKSSIHILMEEDTIEWKKFSKEYDL